MGGIIMTRQGLKILETASGACLVPGFILTAGAGDIRTALIGLPLLAFAAWGFNKAESERKKAREEKR